MPSSLRFSTEIGSLTQQFKDPKVLPCVGIRLRNGKISKVALVKLRNMILARAFPQLSYKSRLGRVTEVFDNIRTLDYLCLISGGHIRNLMRLLNTSIHKEMKVPITYLSLESVIIDHLNERLLAISSDELELLREIRKTKKVTRSTEYQELIRSLYVYEYRDRSGSWFDVNPILLEAREF